MKSKVFFSRDITPETALKLYKMLDIQLEGNVAIKVHSGEPGNQNFIRPDFWRPIICHVDGTVVECNTAYEGGRDTTERHMQTMHKHGWDAFAMDILDAKGPDMELAIPNGIRIKKNFVGKDIAAYDSALILSHFKGHPAGGYGGALKQLSIGFASSYGKKYIHGVGDPENFWESECDAFLEAMADSASSVVEFFKGKIAYVNVMKNMSVDCDCFAKPKDPCMADIGILASVDPVAIDQACLDLVYGSDDPGKEQMIARIESRNGVHTIEAAAQLGLGNREYELIVVE